MPSMIEAWFSASETIRSFSPVDDGDHAGVGGEAGLEGQHRLDVLELGQLGLQASRGCVMLPAIVRTAPEPAPKSRVAAMAASTSRGWVVRPR